MVSHRGHRARRRQSLYGESILLRFSINKPISLCPLRTLRETQCLLVAALPRCSTHGNFLEIGLRFSFAVSPFLRFVLLVAVLPLCTTQAQNLEILSSKINDSLSPASLELTEYPEKAFFVCQRKIDKQKGFMHFQVFIGRRPGALLRIGTSSILNKQILLCVLRVLCERHMSFSCGYAALWLCGETLILRLASARRRGLRG